jgi:multiple sugar transport system substrate-binding protein
MNTKQDITLRGMTWDHPRGWLPLEACAAEWQQRTGVTVTWDRRSLQDFESYPVEELARRYDLIIIDHPHVGQICKENCLLPLDDARLQTLAGASVCASYPSYFWQGRQWAVPVDAASQVQAWCSDRIAAPASSWDEVMELARAGRVTLPLRAPHALMCLFTLVAQMGQAANGAGPQLFDPEVACDAVERLRTLLRLVDPVCQQQDPIAAFDDMAQPGSRVACAPLIFGYVNYAWEGFRPVRLRFADIPSFPGRGPQGAVLGGTGMAISSQTAHPREALEFALWSAEAATQAGVYARSGGQPAHPAAWESAEVNAESGDFYRATRKTLEGSWVRPRHDGYMWFQDAGSRLLLEGLQKDEPAQAIVAALNKMYTQSQPA